MQYDAIDCLLGRRNPECGGDEACLDVIGVNYYPHNQWWASDPIVKMNPDECDPLSELLMAAFAHYRRPLLLAETGCEGPDRAGWFSEIDRQVRIAEAAGVVMLGVCWYPILDHPGWDDDRHCEHGLLCGYKGPPRRVHAPLAAAMARATRARAGDTRRR